MKARNIFILFFLACLCLCCQEKDIMKYENEARIYLEIPGDTPSGYKDSLVYSFPTRMDDRIEDTLWFRAVIMGLPVAWPRTVSLEVNNITTTAQEGVHYQLKAVTIPADSFCVRVPVVIYRTEDLKRQAVRLRLDVVENRDFDVGYGDRNKVILVWGDYFLKPDNWDSSNYLPCFGEYTATRYGFILRTARLYELPPPTSYTSLSYLNLLVREALYRYNQEHDQPLTDELGRVEFPVWGGASAG